MHHSEGTPDEKSRTTAGTHLAQVTLSVAGGACVEFAGTADHIMIRDSKEPSVHFSFDRDRVAAFVERVREDQYSHLLSR